MIYHVFENKYILRDYDLLNWIFCNLIEVSYRTSCPQLYMNPIQNLFNLNLYVEIWGLNLECLLFINSSQEFYLSDVGLNPPPQSQHNEGVGGCN